MSREAVNRKSYPKGMRFGSLTLLDCDSFSRVYGKKPRAVWLMKCDCGKKIKVIGQNVYNGLTKSCGCKRVKTKESTLRNFWLNYKADAERRNYSFRLSLNEFKKLILRPCYYCKDEPSERLFHYSKMKIKVNGIDRINNKLGYSIKNCVPCCSTCNRMKLDLSYNDFMDKIQAISNRSCGDDYNTRTTYVSEANVGDTTKVMLLCIYDLVEKFNMQKAEVMALFKSTLDEHIIEEDEMED